MEEMEEDFTVNSRSQGTVKKAFSQIFFKRVWVFFSIFKRENKKNCIILEIHSMWSRRERKVVVRDREKERKGDKWGRKSERIKDWEERERKKTERKWKKSTKVKKSNQSICLSTRNVGNHNLWEKRIDDYCVYKSPHLESVIFIFLSFKNLNYFNTLEFLLTVWIWDDFHLLTAE